MDEIEVEAFRADTRASRGITAAHIKEAAESYDAEKAPAPLVFGHPAHDSPALGVISGARAEGNKLFVRLKNIHDAVKTAVRERRILGRSVAFWSPDHPSNPVPGKYTLRHLGLLGGMAPAIPGMAALRFSADESTLESDEDGKDIPPEAAVVFTAEPEGGTPVATVSEPAPAKTPKEPTMTEEEIKAKEAEFAAKEKEIADREKAAKAKEDEFAAAAKAQREGENKATVDKAVAEGRILPAEADDLVKVFNSLPTDALTFSAGENEPRKVLGDLLGKLPKRTPVADGVQSPTSEFNADDAKAEADKALKESTENLTGAWKAPVPA